MKKPSILNVWAYPKTILVLIVCAFASIFSYLNYDYAKFWSVTSNVVYLAPLFVSIEIKHYMFTFLFAIVIIISSFYHACQTYDACIYNLNNSMAIDVMFSWLLLLTLVSYVAFKEYYVYLVVVNFVIVVLSHEAHCPVLYLGYDCEFVKMIIVAIYFVIIVVQNIKHEKELDITDSIVGLICFAIAFFFYATYSENNKQIHYANHALWHVFGAAAGALVLTVYKESSIHLWGWFPNDKHCDDEVKQLIRKDIY